MVFRPPFYATHRKMCTLYDSLALKESASEQEQFLFDKLSTKTKKILDNNPKNEIRKKVITILSGIVGGGLRL